MKRKLLALISLILSIPLLLIDSTTSVYAKQTYTNAVSVKSSGSELVIEPTMIYEPTSFDSISGNYTSMVFTLDSDLNVTLGSETKSFTKTFDSYVKGKYIPIVRLDDNNVDKFINYYKNTYTISDLMIMSSSIDVIKKVYEDEQTYVLCSVYDLTNLDIGKDRYFMWDYIASANKVGCNILMLDGTDENLNVASEYVEAMSKVVWGYVSDITSATKTITSGCYGVVSNNKDCLDKSISLFSKKGLARAMYIAAHRGITYYANENSLTSCAAAYSEGATHIEVDLQVLKDGEIVLCHNSETRHNSDKNGWYFVNLTSDRIKEASLTDYSSLYNETYSTLDELIDLMVKFDIIMILELKFDNGSTKAVDELKCIEKFKEVMDRHPEAKGHYYAITFFAPLAKKMKELMPEIPLGFIGAGQSGKETDEGLEAWSDIGHKELYDYINKIKFVRYYNVGIDESYIYANGKGEYYSNITGPYYLAHGYALNTWTYEDTSFFNNITNVATTDVAERVALLVKTIDVSNLTSISKEQLNNLKLTTTCYSYNGWKYEKECDVIVVNKNENEVTVMLYYYQECDNSYGIYSDVLTLNIL